MKKIVRFLSVVGLSALVATFAQAQDVNNASGYVQVYDVASVSNLPLNEYKQYHKEGDIADVSYLFWSSLGKMKVKIENTTYAPIYVNWSKSTYTVEGIELPMTPIENELPDVQYKHYVRYKASDPTITDMDYEWQKIAMGREEKKDEISEILPKGTYTKGNYYLVANDKRVDKGIVLDTASANYSEKHNVKKNEKATIYKQEFTQENYHTIGTSCPRSGCADCCVYHVATEHFVVAGPGEWGLEGPPGRGNPTPDPSHLGKEEGKLMEACPIAIK